MMMLQADGAEFAARESGIPWRKWGPYLSERQWGTVREDYSDNGDAWNYVSHDKARSYAYRWGEDGLAGFTDAKANLCFALALWDGQDSILKERAFGLSNPGATMAKTSSEGRIVGYPNSIGICATNKGKEHEKLGGY